MVNPSKFHKNRQHELKVLAHIEAMETVTKYDLRTKFSLMSDIEMQRIISSLQAKKYVHVNGHLVTFIK